MLIYTHTYIKKTPIQPYIDLFDPNPSHY